MNFFFLFLLIFFKFAPFPEGDLTNSNIFHYYGRSCTFRNRQNGTFFRMEKKKKRLPEGNRFHQKYFYRFP